MNLAGPKFTKSELALTDHCGGWPKERDFDFDSALTGNIVGGTAYLWVDVFAAKQQ